jgi:hypothetical protein
MPLTGIDDAWQTRLPQGWTQMPDGSYGPSSGLPDWLKQLIPSPGAATPNAPGMPTGAGPQGLMPGGGVMGRQAATPGAPSMGFPAQGGPPGPTFQQGQPMGPDVTGGVGGTSPGGLQSLLSMNMNPYARAAIAGAGVMAPQPAGGPDAPTNLWMQRPSGVGGMPGPQVTNPGMPHRPYSPTPQNYPSWPTPGPGVSSPAATIANAPPGNPSDTPRPNPPMPPRRPKNLGAAPTAAAAAPSSSNPRFGTVQYQVPGSGQGGPLSRSPIYTALNLFGGRS